VLESRVAARRKRELAIDVVGETEEQGVR